MINAASATLRRLIETRSNSTATSMIEIIIQDLTAETAPPEIRI